MPGDSAEQAAMTNLDQRVRRAREYLDSVVYRDSNTVELLCAELAAAVVKMAEELESRRSLKDLCESYKQEGIRQRQRIQELEAQLATHNEADAEHDKVIEYARKIRGRRDVHSVYEVLDWQVAQIAQLELRAAFGDQCYQDRCENAYVEQSVLNRVEKQIATARKLIQAASEMMTISVPEWDAGADQFMKETEGL